MPILLICIDRRIVTDIKYVHLLDKHQEISKPLTYDAYGNKKTIHIINPTKLARLVEEACTKYDGLRIVSKLPYPVEFLSILADNLYLDPKKGIKLSRKARDKLVSSPFHSITMDYKFFTPAGYTHTQENFDKIITYVRQQPQNIRLRKILQHYPELQNQQIVYVNNDLEQTMGVVNDVKLNKLAHISTVCEKRETPYYIFTTVARTSRKDYCLQAIDLLKAAKFREQLVEDIEDTDSARPVNQASILRPPPAQSILPKKTDELPHKKEKSDEFLFEAKKELPLIKLKKMDKKSTKLKLIKTFPADKEYLDILADIDQALDQPLEEKNKLPCHDKRLKIKLFSTAKSARRLEASRGKENEPPSNTKSAKVEPQGAGFRFHAKKPLETVYENPFEEEPQQLVGKKECCRIR